jgi:hypothetical protein
VSSTVTSVDGSLNGWDVADQYGVNQYQGNIGHLGLIPGQVTGSPTIDPNAIGTFLGDPNDTYDGRAGLVGFCIDSETSLVGAGTGQLVDYEAYTWDAAETRYLVEGVSGYRPGGLRRAAYLLENFFVESEVLGSLGAASMQAAIWEVLTDESPSLALNDGNYFVRNNTGDATLDSRSNQIVAQTANWFASAEADNWGRADYEPGGGIVFWLDPEATSANQSVITFNGFSSGLDAIPEPHVAFLGFAGLLLSLRRRRRELTAA